MAAKLRQRLSKFNDALLSFLVSEVQKHYSNEQKIEKVSSIEKTRKLSDDHFMGL